MRDCRYGCSGDNLNCIPGEWCPSETCSGGSCPFPGPYGETVSTVAQCIKQGDPAPTETYENRWATNLIDCLGSCGGGGNWCNIGFWYCCGSNEICTATCAVDTTCTYECYDTGGGLNQQYTCTDGGACINGCDDFCFGNNKVGFGCVLDTCNMLVGIACPAGTNCVNGACV